VDAPRGPPLDRHKDAVRDTKPAWMTKGFGVGVAMLGEATGELVKPGMTKTDLERMESDSKTKPVSSDPFADFFAETSGGAAALAKTGYASANDSNNNRSGDSARAPLPSQDSAFETRA